MLKYPFDGSQLCYGQDTNLFFRSEDDHPKHESRPLQDLKYLCDRCPLQTQCLEWALHHERDGFWGGADEKQLKAMRKRLNIMVVPTQPEQFVQVD